ncbi:MAG: GNAT family N-acetyltransferase [Candidatus Hodarchaeales archaeon]|jgi:hypothetical protein
MNQPLVYHLDLNSIEKTEGNSIIQNFNPLKDIEEWIDIFTSSYDLPRNNVKEFLNSLRKNQNLIEHVIGREEGKIVGTTAIIRNPDNPQVGFLNAIYGTETTHLEKLICYLKPICIKNGIQVLQMTFTHLNEESPEIKIYEKLGFKKKLEE